jgi:crossover junction endodeoxyribonuclease RusA
VRLNGDVVAVYTFGRPDKRRRDVANLEKAASDTMTRWGVLEDDSQIVDIRLRWGGPDEVRPGGCLLRLEERGVLAVALPNSTGACTPSD